MKCDLKASTDVASLICRGNSFPKLLCHNRKGTVNPQFQQSYKTVRRNWSADQKKLEGTQSSRSWDNMQALDHLKILFLQVEEP